MNTLYPTLQAMPAKNINQVNEQWHDTNIRDEIIKSTFEYIGIESSISAANSAMTAHGRLLEVGFSSGKKLMFWFIRNEDEPNFKGQSWHKLLESWLKLIPSTGRFGPVNGAVMTLDDLTARDYVESDPLDLDHLSFRPA